MKLNFIKRLIALYYTKPKQETPIMMEFKTTRSINTFLENYTAFRAKFGITHEVKDFQTYNWLIHNKRFYWWAGDAKGDPQFNELALNLSRHENITVVTIQQHSTDSKFSLILDNTLEHKRTK
jgi:hypothetical protein